MMPEGVDPITFEVIRNALDSIADEMAIVLMRSAYSPIVRDSLDYSTAGPRRRPPPPLPPRCSYP
jgi:N-methylhydantoinase B